MTATGPGQLRRRTRVTFLDDYVPPVSEEEAKERLAAVDAIILAIEEHAMANADEREDARWAVHYRQIERGRLQRAYEDFRRDRNDARRRARATREPRPPRDPVLTAARREENERNRREKEAWWTENGVAVAKEAYGLLCDVLRVHAVILSDDERERLAALRQRVKHLPRAVRTMAGLPNTDTAAPQEDA
jgi:uncharacterized short protein YbdD (DUF466 family)